MTGFILYPKRHLKKLIKEGEYVDALEFGKSIESKFSNDPDYYFILGSIYYILEDYKKAITFFDKSISFGGKDIEVLMLKTNAHLSLQEKDSALTCVKKILEIDPKNNEAISLYEKLIDSA